MKHNRIHPTDEEKQEIADTMLTLLQRGFNAKDAAAYIPRWSYATCIKWLRRIHGDNQGRRAPRSKLCTRCGGKPTERDAEEGLTRIRNEETGLFECLCSDCLVPNEEADIAELRQRWQTQNPYGTRHIKYQTENGLPRTWKTNAGREGL